MPKYVYYCKKFSNLEGKSKPGTLVKGAIAEATQDLKEERERLTQRDYKNDK